MQETRLWVARRLTLFWSFATIRRVSDPGQLQDGTVRQPSADRSGLLAVAAPASYWLTLPAADAVGGLTPAPRVMRIVGRIRFRLLEPRTPFQSTIRF